MTTFRVSTADYNAGSDLYAAVVKAGLELAPLHPLLTDPGCAHLPMRCFVEPPAVRPFTRVA